MGLLNLNKETLGGEDMADTFTQVQEVLMRVAQYFQPVREIQMVCDHPSQIIALQKHVTDLQMKQFLPASCDYTPFEQQIQQLRNDLDDTRRTPRTAGTDEEIRQELDEITRDAQVASAEASSLRTQIANALSLAARLAPTPPQGPEERGQKFPDSPDFSGLARTQSRGWTAPLRMIVRHKPSSFPNEQLKMRYAFNHLSGLALRQILPHVRENGEVDLGDLSAFIQLLEAAFGDHDRVATMDRNMKDIKQKNREFSQYYAEFQVIAADLDWNPSALRNALRSGLSEEMKDSFTYSDVSDDLGTFVSTCQKRDDQIRHRKAERAAQHKWSSSTGLPSAPRAPVRPMAPEAAPAGTVARYTGPEPMDLSADRRRISDEERAKRFADARCLYCGGFNHKAVDCMVRKQARSFKAAGAEVKEVGEKDDLKEKGKERVD
jgi:hypothetical protein